MKILSLKFLLYTVFSITIFSSSGFAQSSRPVGINLTAVKDWSEEFVFVDIMNQSRDWIFHDIAPGSDWQSDVNIPLRQDGYPLEIPYNNGVDPAQSARTLFYFGELENIYPEGSYRLKIDGTGQVRLWGAANGTFQCPIDTYVSVDNSLGGVALEIEESIVSDPVHNIRFIMPGFENVYENEPFHPSLLEFLEDFHVIRFMDWLETNGSVVQEWDDRNLQSHFTQTSENGVAYEYLIELSNLLQKDLWVNVPHQASDDFITQFARLLRDNVDPNLKIYLEYSNEVWNGIFPQYTYAGDLGLVLGYEGEPWERAWTFTAKRSADVFHIFENEFNDDDRFIKVLPGFAVSNYINNFIIEQFNDIEFNPNQVTADALTIAPYFGGAVADDLADAGLAQSATISQLLDLLEQSLPESYQSMDEAKALADANGLDLIAYEGGQHLVANYPNNNDPVYVDKLLEANRNPRMQDFYCEYMDYWYSTMGGGMFALFSSHGGYNQFGSWGIKETYENVNSPKYQALVNCVFSANENPSNASPDVVLSYNAIELLADTYQDVFTVEGLLTDYDINVYDANDVLVENYGSPSRELSIDLTTMPEGLHYITIEHLSNDHLSFQQIISE